MYERGNAGLAQDRAISPSHPRRAGWAGVPQQRLLGLVTSWWGEDILAKGSLVVSFFLRRRYFSMGNDPTPRMLGFDTCPGIQCQGVQVYLRTQPPHIQRPPNRWICIVTLK